MSAGPEVKRYYPTDVLLAVESGERELAAADGGKLAALLRSAGLAPLWSVGSLARGLDDMFGGLGQYPWQHQTDTDEVIEFRPVGTVVLDDLRRGNTLRGLLLGWAAGNEVVIRGGHAAFWAELAGLLRGYGHPLPPSRFAAAGEAVRGAVPVAVPDLVVPATWADDVLWAVADPAANPDGEAIRISPGPDTTPEAARRMAASAVRLDCRSAWTGRLFRREYLVGGRLAAVRDADPDYDGRIAAKLRYLVGTARRTPYLSEAPRVCDRADLAALPVMEKEDLEANSPPAGRGLSTGAPPSGEVLRSGATTGALRYVMYSLDDWDNMVREAIAMLYECRLRPGDRIVNVLYGGSLYGGLVTSQNEIARMPVEAYSFGHTITAKDLVTFVRDFGANVVLGQPSLLVPLLRDAKALEPGLRIEKVIYGGSPMAEPDKRWLRDDLGVLSICSVLAANDGAQLGYQCGVMSGNLHHLCEDFSLLEVVDSQGRPLPDGEAGDLLVTCMQKFDWPLIRYRIGDVGRIVRCTCACGRDGRVLEYLGRSDGMIKVKTRSVLHSEIMAELARFGISSAQVEIITRGHTETVVLRTESPHTVEPEAVRAHLAGTFEVLSDYQAFDDSIEMFRFEVECHPDGYLERNPVSGKIRPVIDRRVEAR
jgi:phenylacetate-coenzyme A ligase PaaK-like adenylate-forming protein